jgi:signal transduction histidine kinase
MNSANTPPSSPHAPARSGETAIGPVASAVAVIDRDGRVIQASAGLPSLLGVPLTEIIGCCHEEVLGAGPGTALVAASLADGEPRSAVHARPGGFEEAPAASGLPGGARAWQIEVVPVRASGGEAAGLVLVYVARGLERVDVAWPASLSDEPAEVGRLAAAVAHELNTPLASIALRAESLLRAAQESSLSGIEAFARFPRYLLVIQQEAFRCKRIIDALLQLGGHSGAPRHTAAPPAPGGENKNE